MEFEAQLEKKLQALLKRPTPSIAISRSQKLGKFIIQNTRPSEIRELLLERKLSVFQNALDHLGAKSC